MIFNLKFLEKLTQQIHKRKKAKKQKLISEEIKDVELTDTHQISLSEEIYSEFAKEILSNAKLFTQGSGTNESFHYIKTNGVEGIAIELSRSKFKDIAWTLYVQSLLNKLKELQYIKQYAAAETGKKNTDIITDYMHYYKPSFRLSKTLPAEQLYGNITIQVSFLNDIPHRFLVKANTYSDRNYKSPLSFLDLLDHLFFKK